MEWFVVFRYLHIVTMFFAVALALSSEIVVRRVAGTLDPRAISTTVERVAPLGKITTGAFLLGLAFGVIAALTGHINLLAPWLLMSYGAFVLAMAVGGLITDPWVGRLGAAAAASPSDTPSDELRTVVGDPRARWATVLLMVIIATIVFFMVVKPLS